MSDISTTYNFFKKFLAEIFYYLSNFSLLGLIGILSGYFKTLKVIILNLYSFPKITNNNTILPPSRYAFAAILLSIFSLSIFSSSSFDTGVTLSYKLSILMFWCFRYFILLLLLFTLIKFIFSDSVITFKNINRVFSYFYFSAISIVGIILLPFIKTSSMPSLLITGILFSVFLVSVIAKWISLEFNLNKWYIFFLILLTWSFYNGILLLFSEYYHKAIRLTSAFIDKNLGFIFW